MLTVVLDTDTPMVTCTSAALTVQAALSPTNIGPAACVRDERGALTALLRASAGGLAANRLLTCRCTAGRTSRAAQDAAIDVMNRGFDCIRICCASLQATLMDTLPAVARDSVANVLLAMRVRSQPDGTARAAQDIARASARGALLPLLEHACQRLMAVLRHVFDVALDDLHSLPGEQIAVFTQGSSGQLLARASARGVPLPLLAHACQRLMAVLQVALQMPVRISCFCMGLMVSSMQMQGDRSSCCSCRLLVKLKVLLAGDSAGHASCWLSK